MPDQAHLRPCGPRFGGGRRVSATLGGMADFELTTPDQTIEHFTGDASYSVSTGHLVITTEENVLRTYSPNAWLLVEERLSTGGQGGPRMMA